MRRRLKILCVFDLIAPAEDTDIAKELETDDWMTERHVLEALEALGHKSVVVGVYDDVSPLIESVKREEPDVVFNLTEHFAGDRSLDKSIAAILDLLGVPYTGSGTMGLGLARDKALAKKILSYHKIRVPWFVEFKRGRRVKIPKRVPYPLIVKPIAEDASEGISLASLVRRRKELEERVRFVHESVERSAIAEEFIEGREMYCSVLGNDRLRVLPIRELRVEKRGGPKFLTYRLKWDPKYQRKWGLMVGFVPSLPPETARRIARISKRVYRALEMRDYARIDIRLTPEGRVYVLEANPNPFLAVGEDFAESAQEAGIDYDPLIDRILSLALRRSEK